MCRWSPSVGLDKVFSNFFFTLFENIFNSVEMINDDVFEHFPPISHDHPIIYAITA